MGQYGIIGLAIFLGTLFVGSAIIASKLLAFRTPDSRRKVQAYECSEDPVGVCSSQYATFFIISIVGRKQDETFSSLRGLARQSPALGVVLMISMFSLAGIPPLAGFTGKFMLFASAAKEGFYFFVVFAALNSTISLYYYLLLVKEAYILQPAGEHKPLQVSFVQRSSIFNLTIAMVILGVVPFFSNIILQIVR
jgi:NADH:ubiquinone oxidoreductase subunit 2 (subunit N)